VAAGYGDGDSRGQPARAIGDQRLAHKPLPDVPTVADRISGFGLPVVRHVAQASHHAIVGRMNSKSCASAFRETRTADGEGSMCRQRRNRSLRFPERNLNIWELMSKPLA
jgi:hypothetical protein